MEISTPHIQYALILIYYIIIIYNVSLQCTENSGSTLLYKLFDIDQPTNQPTTHPYNHYKLICRVVGGDLWGYKGNKNSDEHHTNTDHIHRVS